MPTLTPLAGSHLQDDARGMDHLRAAVVLSLPSIVGTGFFLAGAIVSSVFGPGSAPEVDAFREATTVDAIKGAIGYTLFLTCYFGAAFGPILIPPAAQQAFALTRVVGARRAVRAWTYVVLAIAAAALFWGWLVTLDLFI